ncbi:MAG: carboxypeptidase regulatory-like domain-containing protein [Treponema sp.]|nr:carboxypeptidase regulatory-like domain-containing protein [Treponema sp.]
MRSKTVSWHISIWAFVLAFLALNSCRSTKFEGTAACTGRICGPHGEAVENYHIDFGAVHSAVTGINGMFLIPELKAGTYRVSGGGKGWSSFEQTVSFKDRRRIFTAQIEPISSVYAKVEELIRDGQFKEAEKMLQKESKYNRGEKSFLFYEKLVSYCKNPSERKKQQIFDMVGEKRTEETAR